VYLFDLTGKVAVVTGGTRGIGLMMARGLLQAGVQRFGCSGVQGTIAS
jgi:NAD(P)-dependent dehydrogenase (short-subunit alcohol dehydrogenase family)